MKSFSLSKISLTRHKKGMKVTTAIYCLALLLTVLTTMISLTLTSHINRVYKTDPSYRIISFFYDRETYSEDEIHQWLSSIPHVEGIIHFTSSPALFIGEMQAKPEWAGGTFQGSPLYEGVALPLLAGREPEPGETHVILVPGYVSSSYLSGTGDSIFRDEEDLIQGESLLGSTLTLLYGDGADKTAYPCQVIGVYDSFSMGMNSYEVILPQKELDRIQEEMGYPISDSPYALVDDYKNLTSVQAEMDKKGFYNHTVKLSEGILADILPVIMAFGLLAGATALLIGAIGVAVTAAGSIRERIREIGMLKAMGYQNRHIRRIILLENGRTCLWAMTISFIICCLLFFGVWYLVRPFLTTLFIGISFSPLIFLAVFAAASGIILLISLLAGLLAAFRACDISPAVALREEE